MTHESRLEWHERKNQCVKIKISHEQRIHSTINALCCRLRVFDPWDSGSRTRFPITKVGCHLVDFYYSPLVGKEYHVKN
jgi:hypothetical protein